MKRTIITLLFVIGIFVTAQPERAEALYLPEADAGFTASYGDFYSYSLPILTDYYGYDIYDGGAPGLIKNYVVIATGTSGVPINENFAGMDNAYPTPGDDPTTSFDTGDVADPAPNPGDADAFDGDREETWDATIQSLVTYLNGEVPVLFFNNNETDGGTTQNLWVWAQVELWSTTDSSLFQYYELTSTNGDGSGTLGGDPYAYTANIYDTYGGALTNESTYTPLSSDYVLSGGDICLDAGGGVVSCDTEGATLYVHNLGSNEAAYAIISPELNDFLAEWTSDSGYDMISIDIKMASLDGGYEQAYIMPGTIETTTPVPEPSTWLLLGLGLLCLPLARRFRRS